MALIRLSDFKEILVQSNHLIVYLKLLKIKSVEENSIVMVSIMKASWREVDVELIWRRLQII